MDMEEHPLIFWLNSIKIDKDLYTYLYLCCCLNPSISLFVFVLLDKQNANMYI